MMAGLFLPPFLLWREVAWDYLFFYAGLSGGDLQVSRQGRFFLVGVHLTSMPDSFLSRIPLNSLPFPLPAVNYRFVLRFSPVQRKLDALFSWASAVKLVVSDWGRSWMFLFFFPFFRGPHGCGPFLFYCFLAKDLEGLLGNPPASGVFHPSPYFIPLLSLICFPTAPFHASRSQPFCPPPIRIND